MAKGTQKFQALFAVDTNVLIDWANGHEDIPDCFDLIKKRIPGAVVIVPPTVLHELGHFVKHGSGELKKSSIKALELVRDEPMLRPLNLVPVGHGIVEVNAWKIQEKGLIDFEETNDAYILAEVALLDCTVLLTSDSHLTHIDHNKLSDLMNSCDCVCPIISTPQKILTQFSAPTKSKGRKQP